MRVIVLAIMLLFASSANAETLTHVEASAMWGSESFTASWNWNADPNLMNSVVEGSVLVSSTIGEFTSFLFHPLRFGEFYSSNGYTVGIYAATYAGSHVRPLSWTGSIFAAPGEYTFCCWFDGFYLSGPGIGSQDSYAPFAHLSVTPIVTPEPGTWAMMLLGLVLLYILYCYNQKVGNVVQLVRGKW